MISIYWPKKAVPNWLLDVETTCYDHDAGDIHHVGFGLIVRVGKSYVVLGVSGYFMKILNCKNVMIFPAPVIYTSSVRTFIQELRKGGEI